MFYKKHSRLLLITALLIAPLPVSGWETGSSKILAACKRGDANQVARLLQSGVSARSSEFWSRSTCLIYATQAESVAAVQSLLLYGAVDTPNVEGDTALIIAARSPKENKHGQEIARFLLEAGSYINRVNKKNRSALMEAVSADNNEIVRMLLDFHAYTEMKDDRGNTAFLDAVVSGNIEMVQLLLEAGADAEHVNDAGQIPLDLAQSLNYTAIVDLIEADRVKKEAEKLEGPSLDTLDGIRRRLKALPIAKHYKKALEGEIDALADVYTSEAALSYLRLVFTLPWVKTTTDNLDLIHAQKVLDDSHWGLQEVKEAIIEFIAGLAMKGEGPAPILCLAGPPGIGKTSIVKTIADCLGRNYAKIALGGVQDQMKLRGMIRSYKGSSPGDIIEAMKYAGSHNPVILLDEIDKAGDPAHAVLLEILDPEQNSTFRDDYVQIPFDLSSVIFITTVNDITKVPTPLLDRMHVISLPGYLFEEKKAIAERYLINQVKKEIGLKDHSVDFESDALSHLIEKYTMESGVRKTKLLIKKVLSKMMVRHLLEKKEISERLTVTLPMLEQFLGTPPLKDHAIPLIDQIGTTNGLYWSSVGGGILNIEAILIPRIGNGSGDNLMLTGQLQDVTQESAQIALSYALSKSEQFGVDTKKLDTHMIHIHIPEGAVPKDGPSAGAAFFTSIVSVLSDRKIKAGYAMTGEINLRGQVTAIGGLDQKLLGARRLGVMNVFVSIENRPDVEKAQKKGITKDMNIIFVETVEEIINQILA